MSKGKAEMSKGTTPIEISVADLRALREAGRDVRVVDVRSAAEFAEAHVDGAVNVPGPDLFMHLEELRKADAVVCVCTKGGGRSAGSAGLLRDHGLSHARFLVGGTLEWLARYGEPLEGRARS